MRCLIPSILIASMVAAPLAAARKTPEERFAQLTAGRTAGKPVDCIRLYPSADSVIIPHKAIAYRQGSAWYVNEFHGDCPQLSDDTILVTRTPGTQLCRGDSADLRSSSSHMVMGACIFDSFTPYMRKD